MKVFTRYISFLLAPLLFATVCMATANCLCFLPDADTAHSCCDRTPAKSEDNSNHNGHPAEACLHCIDQNSRSPWLAETLEHSPRAAGGTSVAAILSRYLAPYKSSFLIFSNIFALRHVLFILNPHSPRAPPLSL